MFLEFHLSNYECARFISHLCNRNMVQNILLIHGSNRIGRSISGKKETNFKFDTKSKYINCECGNRGNLLT